MGTGTWNNKFALICHSAHSKVVTASTLVKIIVWRQSLKFELCASEYEYFPGFKVQYLKICSIYFYKPLYNILWWFYLSKSISIKFVDICWNCSCIKVSFSLLWCPITPVLDKEPGRFRSSILFLTCRGTVLKYYP